MSRHLLAIRQLEPTEIRELLNLARDFKKRVVAGQDTTVKTRRAIGLLLFENSTRTRVSFEQAASYLGHRTVNFSGAGSSMRKGETLKDTILTLRFERLEALVMRHPAAGAAALAAKDFGSPVINAGDGQHEHPTQALGDALTIMERKGGLDGLVVAIVGDVNHSRVARSNAWLLTKMGAEVRFVGPRTLMPSNPAKLPGSVYYDLRTGVADADVIMCLRLQRERMDDGLLTSVGEYRRQYQVTRSVLRSANQDVLVMHPGPLNRGVEIDDSTADGANSAIADQVSNGIFVRMAALHWVFEEAKVAAGGKA
ncbi:MAG: aspartate carbamoyltransferase catalytic subunit [Fimbriimonadaceae bacterium]|nr:MAG: aspartate carbamoyltransferase catalytic subunit [Fimbriimonadaceae bacterium]